MATASAVLRQQLAGYHAILEQTMDDIPADALDRTLPGATIGNIASVYAHTVFSEDQILHGMLQGRAPLYRTGNWATRTGLDMPATDLLTEDWSRAAKKLNLVAFREYAKAVYAASDAFVAGLSDADLDRKLDTGFIGEQTVAFIVSNVLGWHAAEHNGEIAALKGAFGLKGLPF